MIVHLTTRVYDLDGHIEIETLQNTDIGNYTRRVSRTSTLDGSVAVHDGGFAEGDRTIVLRWLPVTLEQEEAILRLTKLYGQLTYSDDTGAYLVVPQIYTPGLDESSLTLLIIEKESE